MQQATSVNRHDDLKILALITMLIDHTGLLFFPSDMLFRTIGRIAFPIFAWQLVEGFCHTSNLKNYMTRIALFGCIAQLPYMFLSPELDFEPLRINILFQLLSGLALLWCAKKLQETVSSDKQRLHIPLVILLVLSILLLILLPDFISVAVPGFQFSYGTYGQLLVLLFYVFRGNQRGIIAAYSSLSLWHAVEVRLLYANVPEAMGLSGIANLLQGWFSGSKLLTEFTATLLNLPTLSVEYFQARSMLALIPIFSWTRTPSHARLNKWVAYGFYPGHLIVLVGIRYAMLHFGGH